MILAASGLAAIAAAIALAPAPASARMSTPDYRSAKDRVESDYKAARASCGPLAASARDICMAEAKGGAMVGRTELQAKYRPSARTRYVARLARAEADYWVAKAKCDHAPGDVNRACQGEADAARTASKGDARAQLLAADKRDADGAPKANPWQ